MKNLLLSLLVLSLFVFTSASANKAEWSDKATPSFDQTEISDFPIAGGKDKPKKNKDKAKKAKKEKVELDDDVDKMKKDKVKKAKKEKDELDDDEAVEDSDKLKGIEKQTAKKADQEQKELGKGSEQGQESREEHRKKWWQFSGDESEE